MAEPDHRCEWRERCEALEGTVATLEGTVVSLKGDVAELTHQIETLKRHLVGPKSEKMPRVEDELRDEKPPDKEAAQRKRKERAKARQEALQKKTTVHPVPPEEKHCPKCGGDKFRPLGPGKKSVVYEYVPGHFVAHEHVCETVACSCGEYIITAEPPAKWVDKSQYAPSFIAHIITAKTADSIPIYRLEKELQRIGVFVARSTMNEMLHRAAELLAPLYMRLEHLVRHGDIVRADETSEKVMAKGHCKTGYIWTFRTRVPEPLIVYRFAMNRSGETPLQVLGGTQGTLVVDGHTGYNSVTKVDGRDRQGCNAHLRRYFFDALKAAPEEARKALDFILALYRVEHEALERGIVGTPEHLALRKERSGPIRDAFKMWLEDRKPLHGPKTPFGVAIKYALNQWEYLGLFLTDARIPLDNNESEAALRRVALGRKNFLFVGHEGAGENLAGLYSLVATCEANDVNPVAYLTDVLMRIADHPNSAIDELLPHRWRGPPGASTAAAA